jgi:hypothetical protein
MPSTGSPPLRRRVARGAVVVAAGASMLLPAAVASAEATDPATSVVGELLQAWPEDNHAAGAGSEADHEPQGPLSWVQTADGGSVRVATADVAGVPAGATVQVSVGGEQADAASVDGYGPAREVLGAQVLAPAPAAPVLRSPAGLTNEVTVAMVSPRGTTRDGATLRRLVETVDGAVADFWSEQTDGAIELGVTAARDWFSTTAGCADPTALWAEAAEVVGFTPGPGKHLLLYVSSTPGDLAGCSYALGQVGAAPGSGGRLYVRDTVPSVIAHEFGHNFGLGHSSALQCDAAVETGACRTQAYRDYYDVMGASWSETGSLNAAQAARLGLLPGAEQTFTADGSGGTVTLAPLSGRSGTRALRLTGPSGLDYWLEYRTASGRDTWLGSAANVYRLEEGVLLRRAGGLPDTSVLLDGTPGGSAGWDADLHPALLAGRPLTVGGAFTVTVESVSAAGATVRVTTAPAAAPAVPAPAPGTGAVGDLLPARDGAAAPGVRDEPAAPVAAPAAAAPDGRPGTIPAVPTTARSAGTPVAVPAVAAVAVGGLALVTARTVRRGRRRSG